MAGACEVCGKSAAMGNSVTHRGKAKYLGGVGTKITGITRRQFRPNLQKVRVTTANGTHKTVRVCTQCLRSGAVTKTIRNAPFRLPPGEQAEKADKAKGDKAKPGKSKPGKPRAERPESTQPRKKKKSSRKKKKK